MGYSLSIIKGIHKFNWLASYRVQSLFYKNGFEVDWGVLNHLTKDADFEN